MKKGCPISVDTVGNGWVIRPYSVQDPFQGRHETFVFNHLEYDQQGSTSLKTVFGFLRDHFSEVEEQSG